MSEWWTYSFADFLLFSPRTYYRLFELYNAAVWPGQILAIALGFLIVLLLISERRPWRGQAIASILAAGWLWVAWAYFYTRYATINWVAVYFAAAFAIEALLLILVHVIGDKLSLTTDVWSERAGAALLAFALFVQPLLGPLFGRAWTEAETFGGMPNPTVVATLAVLGLSRHGSRWALLVIPILWCMVTGVTEWTMASPDAWVMPLAMAIALALAVQNSGRNKPRTSDSKARAGVRPTTGLPR